MSIPMIRAEISKRKRYMHIQQVRLVLSKIRKRIPDGATKKFIQEVKNVKSLSYTSQIKDSIQIALNEGKGFNCLSVLTLI